MPAPERSGTPEAEDPVTVVAAVLRSQDEGLLPMLGYDSHAAYVLNALRDAGWHLVATREEQTCSCYPMGDKCSTRTVIDKMWTP